MIQSARRRRHYANDVAIALAILVVLLGLWIVLTRGRELGPHGAWLQSHIFGAAGLRVGRSFGVGDSVVETNGGNEAAPWAEGASTNPASLLSDTNPPRAAANAPPTSFAAGPPAVPPDSNTNPVTLIAPLDNADGPISSNEAVAFAKRLDAAGAQTGDIQISLYWNNFNDLDLHCIDPKQVEIYFSHKESELTGGRLDVDRNANAPYTVTPVENIFWPAGGAPSGRYQVYVVHYSRHSDIDQTPFKVRTVIQGKTNFFAYAIRYTGRERQWICSFDYDPSNPDPEKRCHIWKR
jgi:hypothetical protein